MRIGLKWTQFVKLSCKNESFVQSKKNIENINIKKILLIKVTYIIIMTEYPALQISFFVIFLLCNTVEHHISFIFTNVKLELKKYANSMENLLEHGERLFRCSIRALWVFVTYNH